VFSPGATWSPFGFKRPCPLVGITQRRSLRPPVPKKMGRHSEIDGAPFRKRWGTVPTFPIKCPTSRRNRAPLRSESVPHFRWNQCPTSPGIRTSLAFENTTTKTAFFGTSKSDDALARKLQSRGNEVVFLGVPDAADLTFVPFCEKDYPIGSMSKDWRAVAKLQGQDVVRYTVRELAPHLLCAGKRIDAVAQVTKQGFKYVFDRVTGKPVWPIVERPVPTSSDVSNVKPYPTSRFRQAARICRTRPVDR
jgi:hypothetical protein